MEVFSHHLKPTLELCRQGDAVAVAAAYEIHPTAACLLVPQHHVHVLVVVAAAKVHRGLCGNYCWGRLLNRHSLCHICRGNTNILNEVHGENMINKLPSSPS